MMKYLAALGFILLSGCAAPGPITLQNSDAKSFKGRTLKVIVHEPFSFALLSGPKGLMGALGGLSMELAGEKFIRDNNIIDPANNIATSLTSDLSRTYEFSNGVNDDVSAGEEVELHIKTTFWALGTTLTTGDKWNIMYWPEFKLTDAKTGKIYAKYNCVKKRLEATGDPTLVELTENGAVQFKILLERIADECKEEFKSSLGTAV